MKALILAGGRGTRLRPLTHTKNKHLIPIGNEPMIYRVVKDVIDAGIHEIIININAGDTSIKEAIEAKSWEANFEYIEQKEPNGMMYPIVLSKDLIGDEKFILHGGDNVLSGGLKKYIDKFEKSDVDATLLVTKVDNPERFGVAVVEGNRLVKTVEKPKDRISDLAMTAIYIYTPVIFEAMQNIEPIDPKGEGKFEYYPPPAHQWLVDNGYTVTVEEVTGWWKDTGKPDDLLLANRLVLEKRDVFKHEGTIEDSEISGNVEVKKGAKIINSKIQGPVSIGEDVIVEDSYIGPFTSIYDNSHIKQANITNSIVLGEVKIHNVTRQLDKSLIGWNANVFEDIQNPEASSLFIGDDSIVNF